MPLAAAVLAAAGFAALELAFFASRNQLLPWRSGHAALFGVFLALHLVVAVGALFAARALGRRAAAWAPFAPLAALTAIAVVTWFRERVYSLPRDLPGTAGTLLLAIVPFAACALAARALRGRPALAGPAALGLAAAVLAAGVVRVALAKPRQEVEPVLPRAASHRLAVTETGQRVLVFGFDGATWEVLDPLIAQGRMPNLAALVARGRTFDLETIRPTFSPVIWTSIATGKSRFRHGIHDVVQTVMPGGLRLPRSIERTAFWTKTTGVVFRALDARRALPLVPYRSGQVQATSVFEAASEAGLSASRIEWYVSHPAVPLSGVDVSDRFHLQTREEPREGATHPAALNEALLPCLVEESEVTVERVLEFVDTTGLDAAGAAAWAAERPAFVEEMRLNLARDLTTRNVAVDLLRRDREWRLFGVYFRAVDLTHHLTWRLRGRTGDPSAEPDLRMKPVIERYHEAMDRIVGDVLAEVPPDAVVILLSDHGFEDRFEHSRAPDGFAVLAGGPIVPSPERGRLTIYDVAPTTAVLLGIPVAQDLDGRPRSDLLDPAFTAAFPPRAVSTWEREGRVTAASTAPDAPETIDAEVERLRALGYIR